MSRVNNIQGWINHEISSGQLQMRRGVRETIELLEESLLHKMLGEFGFLDGVRARRPLHVNVLKELALRKREKNPERPVCLGVGWFGGFVL